MYPEPIYPPPSSEAMETVHHMGDLFFVCDEFRKKTGSWPTNFRQLTNEVAVADPRILYDGWSNEIYIVALTNDLSVVWLESYGPKGVPTVERTNGFVKMELREPRSERSKP